MPDNLGTGTCGWITTSALFNYDLAREIECYGEGLFRSTSGR